MWKLICVLCVLPLFVSPTAANDRDARSIFNKGLSVLTKSKLVPEVPLHSTLVPFWSRTKMSNFTCDRVGTFPFPETCNHLIKCVSVLGHYYSFVFKCVTGRVYSLKDEVCVLLENSDREECRTVTEVVDVTAGKDSLEQETKDALDMEKNLLLWRKNGICVSEGFYGVPTNCSQFYRCVLFGNSFTKFEFSCPPETVWDDDIQGCNYPSEVQRVTCTNVPAGSKHLLYDSSISYYHNFRLTEDQGVFVCPSAMRRHPKYCNLLYQCFDTNFVPSVFQMRCIRGTWFDEQTVQCVSTPPPSDCITIEDETLLTPYMTISNTESLCPSNTSAVPRNSDPCDNEFVYCTKSENGEATAFMQYCVDGTFDHNRLVCVSKSELPECA